MATEWKAAVKIHVRTMDLGGREISNSPMPPSSARIKSLDAPVWNGIVALERPLAVSGGGSGSVYRTTHHGGGEPVALELL